jgi:hypothetical protein
MGETYKSSKRFDSGKKEEVLYEGKGHRKGVIRFVCFCLGQRLFQHVYRERKRNQ